MGWRVTEYGESHDGWAGAVLDDGREPDPTYIDASSGGWAEQTREWWAYSGRLGRPKAAFFRGACSCGWRGPSYPIDWDQVDVLSDRDMDTDAAQNDWHGHIQHVDAQTVPLPEPLTVLIDQLHDQLHALADGAPVAALKAVAEIELITRHAAREAAHTVQMDEEDGSWEAVGKSLGVDAKHARQRVTRYLLPH